MYLAALFMGIAGSLHCAGMCSPLAMTVSNISGSVIRNRILYNLGRITMYGIIGAIVATMGYLFPLHQYQSLLSVALGLVLIILAFAGVSSVNIPLLNRVMAKVNTWIKTLFAKFIQSKSSGALLLLGSLNGLLPCGLTFLAASFCITLTTPLEGFLYMFTFGIGTLPVMLGLVSILDYIKNKLNWNVRTLTIGLMMLSGVLLIARVLMVHIPHHDHTNIVDIVICR